MKTAVLKLLDGNTNTTFYRVKVAGKFVTQAVGEMQTALQQMTQLPPDQQMLAEIVSVTKDGQEMLFE